jgi:hypothetical protein
VIGYCDILKNTIYIVVLKEFIGQCMDWKVSFKLELTIVSKIFIFHPAIKKKMACIHLIESNCFACGHHLDWTGILDSAVFFGVSVWPYNLSSSMIGVVLHRYQFKIRTANLCHGDLTNMMTERLLKDCFRHAYLKKECSLNLPFLKINCMAELRP